MAFVTQVIFNNLESSEYLLIGVSLLAGLMCIFAVGSIVLLRTDMLNLMKKSGFSLDTFHAGKTSERTEEFYETLYRYMSLASHSIRAVGLYKPSTLEPTRPRKQYFEKLYKFLENKSRQNPDFIYERIVQVDTVKSGVLESDQIDRLTFKHCKHLLDIQKRNTEMRASVKQISSVLSPMSFFIIDERITIFLIPTVTPEGGVLTTLKLGTGLVIASQEGTFAREMLNLFETLKANSTEVNSCIEVTSMHS